MQKGPRPDLPLPNKYRYIDTQSGWDDVAAGLREVGELALDTERNGRFAYRERICLIQLSDGVQTFLIDPLAIDDLSAFGELLADESIVKVIHGSDEDIRFFDSDFGFAVSNLFDTGLAARFLGVARLTWGRCWRSLPGLSFRKTSVCKLRTGGCGRCRGRRWITRPATCFIYCRWRMS